LYARWTNQLLSYNVTTVTDHPLKASADSTLAAMATRELFRTYRGILKELTRRKAIRTMNAPAGDYAEHLVAALTRGRLADNSEKSWDVETDTERLQVKSRVVDTSKKNDARQLSPFRTWDFQRAVIVLFDDDYAIHKCVALPSGVVRAHATYRKHVNGHVVMATALLAHEEAEDLTQRLIALSEGS
jgi:hypothetical protein